ncbi:MAG: hypothetical protein GEU76_06295 [Alphaproteobacteria bacterium]|nr:hypothetical protein [Alphaproteobacteria bacterium]
MRDQRSQNIAPYMEAVGLVSAVWAHLELNFDMIIANLTGGDAEAVGCITMQFGSYYPKLSAIIALCKYRGVSKPIIEELKTMRGQLADPAERRNRLIHDAWLIKGGHVTGKASHKVRPARDQTLTECESLRRAINKFALKTIRLRQEIKRELATSSQTCP